MAKQKSVNTFCGTFKFIIVSALLLHSFACSDDEESMLDGMDFPVGENTETEFNTPEKPLNDFSDEDAQSLCNSLTGLFKNETMSVIRCYLQAIIDIEMDPSLDCDTQAELCMETWMSIPNTCSETTSAGFAVCPNPEVTAQDYITCLEDQSSALDAMAENPSCESIDVLNDNIGPESCQRLTENCPDLFQ